MGSVDDILALALEKRFLAAKKLLDTLGGAEAEAVPEEHRAVLRQVDERATKCEEVMTSWRNAGGGKVVVSDELMKEADLETAADVKVDGEWALGAEMFGTKTYYKHDDESGLISVLMKGDQDNLPVFEQMSVINEVDLYKTFIPMCSESCKVLTVSHGEMIAYFYINVAVLSRDAAIHAYGIDCMEEYGTIVLVGNSVDDFPGADIPFKPAGWGHQTMEVKTFNAVVEIVSPTSARTTIIASVDPKVPLPRAMVNFAIKKLAGLILWLIQKKAVAISEAKDLEACPHNTAISGDADFYTHWLLPKMVQLCKLREWVIPDTGVMARLIQAAASTSASAIPSDTATDTATVYVEESAELSLLTVFPDLEVSDASVASS
jgi:hypothetical protein